MAHAATAHAESVVISGRGFFFLLFVAFGILAVATNILHELIAQNRRLDRLFEEYLRLMDEDE